MNLTVKEIYPWLYAIGEPLDVFCYLVVGEKAALLYDTGYGVFNLKETVLGITEKPLTVVLGHGHLDHACGAYQFDGAFMSAKDRKTAVTHLGTAYRKGVIKEFEDLPGFTAPDGFDAEAYVRVGSKNIKDLDINTKTDLGGKTVSFVEMPGHTQGSVGALINEEKVLLNSDAANGHVWIFLPESLPVASYIKMLQKTLELDFKTFFTGHLNEEIPKERIKQYIKTAQNANYKDAVPYNAFSNLKPFIYEEHGCAIVFNERTLPVRA